MDDSHSVGGRHGLLTPLLGPRGLKPPPVASGPSPLHAAAGDRA